MKSMKFWIGRVLPVEGLELIEGEDAEEKEEGPMASCIGGGRQRPTPAQSSGNSSFDHILTRAAH